MHDQSLVYFIFHSPKIRFRINDFILDMIRQLDFNICNNEEVEDRER